MPEDALKTDLYQPSMVLGYQDAGKGEEIAVFELSLRKLPPNRNYLIVAGIAEILHYLENLRFTPSQINYLRQFPQFASLPKQALDSLASFRFTGDVYAMRDGTIAFQNEPVLFIRAPRLQAQFVETFVLGKFRSLTKFASKASRIVDAAGKEVSVLEFGSRHIDPDLAPQCAKAAYLAGCAGTSNVEAGIKYGISTVDIRGTMAHAYVMSFSTELEAFVAYAKSYPDHSILLVDTYDTKQGMANAILVAKQLEEKGHQLRGIRLDSGDLAADSMMARKMLHDAGMDYVKIVLSGDLDEHKIAELRANGAQFDVLGVGKAISTLDDAPHLDCAYKLCEHDIGGGHDYAIKLSSGKATWPGLKQVYRHINSEFLYSHDEIHLMDGQSRGGIPLLAKLMENGKISIDMGGMAEARDYVLQQKLWLPRSLLGVAQEDYRVERSEKLKILQQAVRKKIQEKNSPNFARGGVMPA